MSESCPSPNEGCKYFGTDYCVLSIHHKYWPRKDYTTPTEKRFRQLPDNKELLPRCEHDKVHFTQEAPDKPDLDFMREALQRERDLRGSIRDTVAQETA